MTDKQNKFFKNIPLPDHVRITNLEKEVKRLKMIINSMVIKRR